MQGSGGQSADRAPEVVPPPGNLTWYQQVPVVVIGLLCCWPIGVALVWTKPDWSKRTKWILTAVAIGVALVLMLIGSLAPKNDSAGDSKSEAARSTTSKEAATTSTRSEESSTTKEVTTTVAPSTVAPTTVPSTTQPPKAPSIMPFVVGMNLQAAQDLIQTTGVFFSKSYDCTGRGRMQILDRDWLVVSQTPAAGSAFEENEAVLGVVKYGESPTVC